MEDVTAGKPNPGFEVGRTVDMDVLHQAGEPRGETFD
jgi:hypothetical protein